MHISDLVKCGAEVLHHVSAQGLDVFYFDKLEPAFEYLKRCSAKKSIGLHFQDSRVEEIIPIVVGYQGVNHGTEKVSLENKNIN